MFMNNDLKNIFYQNNKPIVKRWGEPWLRKNNLWDRIILKTTVLSEEYTIKERILFLIHEFKEQPKCESCGIGTHLGQDNPNAPIFRKFCSVKCSVAKRDWSNYKQTPESNAKRERTLFKKYGYSFNSQRPEVKSIISTLLKKRYEYINREKLENFEWLKEEYVNKRRTSIDIADEVKCDYSTVLEQCREFEFEISQQTNYSLGEKQMADFIEARGIKIVRGSKSIISPKELDIFVPEKNLAFEFNGVFWHSCPFEIPENEQRHLLKTQLCEKQNITLIQIYDDEWIEKQDLVKSMILSKLGIYNRKINARECEIKETTSKQSTEFLKENHIQGPIGGFKKLGLFYQSELVSLMVIGNSRFKNNKDIAELLRFCSKRNVSVRGGFSKLLKHFGQKLISYCDRRFSDGNIYKNNGNLISITKPGYFWVNIAGTKRIPRYKTQKHMLSAFLGENFNPEETEDQNMFRMKYRKIYDCGNFKFLLKPS